MSKKEDVKKLLFKYADVKIINNSTKLRQVSFLYKNAMLTEATDPEELIIELEEKFKSNYEAIKNAPFVFVAILEDLYKNVKTLNSESYFLFCSCIYILIKLDIIKNDNKTGLLAMYY